MVKRTINVTIDEDLPELLEQLGVSKGNRANLINELLRSYAHKSLSFDESILADEERIKNELEAKRKLRAGISQEIRFLEQEQVVIEKRKAEEETRVKQEADRIKSLTSTCFNCGQTFGKKSPHMVGGTPRAPLCNSCFLYSKESEWKPKLTKYYESMRINSETPEKLRITPEVVESTRINSESSESTRIKEEVSNVNS